MTPALVFLLVAGVLIKAGWRNQNVIDVLLGRDTENPKGRVPATSVTLGGETVDVSTAAPLSPNAPTGGNPGTVRLSPTALKAGTTLDGAVRGFVASLSGLAGGPLTIGTATNHSQFTVNGNVSDHWPDAKGVGHAADIPARGRTLIRLGQLALMLAGMPRATALKQQGGLFNVGGWQIIFNTHEGGDHTDHLHVGRRH